MSDPDLPPHIPPAEPDHARFIDVRNDHTLLRYYQHLLSKFGLVDNLGLALDDEEGPEQRRLAPLNSMFVPPRLAASHLLPADLLEAETKHQPPESETTSQALKAQRRLLVLGDPGSGKSTLVAQLMVSLAQSGQSHLKAALGDAVPYAFVLRELQLSEVKDWDDLWRAFLAADPIYPELFSHKDGPQIVEQTLSAGQAMILLDGLDELNPAARSGVAAALLDGLRRFPACRWLVTSRIVGLVDKASPELPSALTAQLDDLLAELSGEDATSHEQLGFLLSILRSLNPSDALLGETAAWDLAAGALLDPQLCGFVRRYLLPFQQDQVEQFVRNWFAQYLSNPVLQQQRVGELLTRLPGHPYIETLARVPVLLNMICFIHMRRGQLPDGRAELYERISLTYLTTLDRARGLKFAGQGFDYEAFAGWLGELAYKMALPERRILIPEREVLEHLQGGMEEAGVSDASSQARFALDYLAQRAGLLIPRGQSEGQEQYGFVHLSLQEFFLARHLMELITGPERDESTWQRLRGFTRSSVWREALVLLFELLPARWAAHVLDELFPLRDEQPDAERWLSESALISQERALFADICMNGAVRIRKEIRSQRLQRLWRLILTPKLLHIDSAKAVERLWSDKHGCLDIFLEVAAEMAEIQLDGAPDLSLLARLRHLKGLQLVGKCVRDLRPIEQLLELEALNLTNTNVNDLEPLRALHNLSRVKIIMNEPLPDLSPLQAVKHLALFSMTAMDLSSLGGLSALKTLIIFAYAQTGLGSLKAPQHLRTLILNTSESDLRPLAGLQRLEWLEILTSNVTDLSPLSGLAALQHLDVAGTSAKNLTPLAALTRLQTLHLGDLQVDTSPLAHLEGLTIVRKKSPGST